MILVTSDNQVYYVNSCGEYAKLNDLKSINHSVSYNSISVTTVEFIGDIERAASIEDYLARTAMREL
jgi:hypothetical protein